MPPIRSEDHNRKAAHHENEADRYLAQAIAGQDLLLATVAQAHATLALAHRTAEATYP